MKKERLIAKAKFILSGHLLNPLWLSREERHKRRTSAVVNSLRQYITRMYLPSALQRVRRDTTFSQEDVTASTTSENLWTIWLQGEEQAPRLIQVCLHSIREHSDLPVQVLSKEQLKKRTSLPSVIWEKFEKGMISPAHFSDILRVELLHQYGGCWLDATCLMNAPIPEDIKGCSFFMMRTCPGITGEYSFFQNCFIRAKSDSPTLALWRALMLEYWMNENSAMDYFQHQIMAQIAIENSPEGLAEERLMPRISHESVHLLWHKHGDETYTHERYDKYCRESFFQKTTYKDKTIIPGSIKEHIINLPL